MYGWRHGSSRSVLPVFAFRPCASAAPAAAEGGTQREQVVQLAAPSRDDLDCKDKKQEGAVRAKVDGYRVPVSFLDGQPACG